MREDLNKLLCERERGGSKNKYRPVRSLRYFDGINGDIGDEAENLIGRESMTKRHNHRWGRKSFSENLNPLYGFIHKAVGRQWDDVYSEICSVFDKRSVINQHILIHLFDYVETKLIVGADGNLYKLPYMYQELIPLDEISAKYYVDPRDGFLKWNVARVSRKEASRRQGQREQEIKARKFRVLDKFTELEKVDGIWYIQKYAHRGNSFRKVETCDHARLSYRYEFDYYDENGVAVRTESASSPPTAPRRYYDFDAHLMKTGYDRIATTRNQLSHKQLKMYGVKNG